jgi:hypothetical protein
MQADGSTGNTLVVLADRNAAYDYDWQGKEVSGAILGIFLA